MAETCQRQNKTRRAPAELERKLDLEETDLAGCEAREDVLLRRLNEIGEMTRND